jgi:hypothetical protein
MYWPAAAGCFNPLKGARYYVSRVIKLSTEPPFNPAGWTFIVIYKGLRV